MGPIESILKRVGDFFGSACHVESTGSANLSVAVSLDKYRTNSIYPLFLVLEAHLFQVEAYLEMMRLE